MDNQYLLTPEQLLEQGRIAQDAYDAIKTLLAEQSERKYYRQLLNRFGYDKRAFRNMLIGYYVDDDGFATDESGNRLTEEDGSFSEIFPGELFFKNPLKLYVYKTRDENGKVYYDWRDQLGNPIARIYRSDRAPIMEILTNDDIKLNDPINGLYVIFAGITPEENDAIGLADMSIAIVRALWQAGYQQVAAGFGPQATASAGKGQIKNFAHLAIEFIDNIVKGKLRLGSMDAFHIALITEYINPDNWNRLFTEDSIMGYVNVNGEPLRGLDENGKSISADQATYEEKRRYLTEKLLDRLMQKIVQNLNATTDDDIVDKKPSTIEAIAHLRKELDRINFG